MRQPPPGSFFAPHLVVWRIRITPAGPCSCSSHQQPHCNTPGCVFSSQQLKSSRFKKFHPGLIVVTSRMDDHARCCRNISVVEYVPLRLGKRFFVASCHCCSTISRSELVLMNGTTCGWPLPHYAIQGVSRTKPSRQNTRTYSGS